MFCPQCILLHFSWTPPGHLVRKLLKHKWTSKWLKICLSHHQLNFSCSQEKEKEKDRGLGANITALRDQNMPSFNLHQLWAHATSALSRFCKEEFTEHAKSFATNTQFNMQICKRLICILFHITVLRHTQNGVIWAHLLLLLHRSSTNTVLPSPARPQRFKKSVDWQQSPERGRDQLCRKVHAKRAEKQSLFSLGRENRVFKYFKFSCRDVGSRVFSTCPGDQRRRNRLKVQEKGLD